MVGVIFVRKLHDMFSHFITEFVLSRCRRPPGDVTSHMKSLDADIMKRAIEELKKEVDEMEGRNEILKKKVTEGRSRICALNGSIERHFNNARIIFERLEKTYDQLRSINGVEVIGSE